jgi:hypothetical protein
LAALLALFAQADMRSQPATGAPTLDPALYQVRHMPEIPLERF